MDALSVGHKTSIRWLRVLAGTMLVGAAALTLGVVGCGGGGGGGGGGSGASGSGSITTGLSDPAQECAAPNGPYQSVWVTISNVEAHIGSGSSQTGWQSLTPSLSNAPKQINLLGIPNSQDCFLETLGVTSGLPAGNYQQIRVFMASNGTALNSGAPSPNACASAGQNIWNCVEVNGTFYALDLPSNANTGLKIPPGQLGGGGLSITKGQGLDLDIDVNACQSVVKRGNSGKYSFKPTLRADELGTNPLIAGNVYVASVSGSSVAVPSSSPSPVPNAKLWLENQSTPVAVGTPTASSTQATVDILDQTTLTDSNGHFEFCPVGAGTYEIVASAASVPNASGTPVPSDATITTGVTVASSGGPNNLVIPLVPDATATTAATISGTFTTQSTSGNLGDDVQYAATQAFNSGSVQALIPEASATPSGETEPPTATTGSCSGSNCTSTYSLGIPPGNPVIGAASTTGSGYASPASAPVNYSVFGSASTISTSTTSSAPDCTPSELITQQFSLSSNSASNEDLTFQSCN